MSQDSPHEPERRSLFRRVGRRAMSWMRPAALPFLHRMQVRLQSAVDTSSIPARLDHLAKRLDALVALRSDHQTPVLLQLQRLQIALDALRLDHRDFVHKIEGHVERIEDAHQKNHELVEVLLSRADALLRRSALPLGNEVLLESPSGFLLVPSEDRTLLTAIWWSGGCLERGTVNVLTSLLREGDVVIDVGAHIGLTVLPAARKVGPGGRVVAIEPGSRASALLQQTLALNFVADRVTLHRCAAGNEEGEAHLHLSPILGESSLLDIPTSIRHELVEVKTIDSLIQPGQRVRLVKIDAEGYEPRVWQGMRRVLADNPDLIAVVEFGPAHLEREGISVEDWLAGFMADGFTGYEIDEMSGHVRSLRPVAGLRDATSVNLLLLRNQPATYPELMFE